MGLINDRRASAGLPVLSQHPTLTAIAQDYATLHFLQGDPFQLRHDLAGPMLDRVRRYGYTGGFGETLVTGPGDANVLFDVLMNSPSHRDIIMSPEYREIGVGCYVGPYVDSNGTVLQIALCVSDFGYS